MKPKLMFSQLEGLNSSMLCEFSQLEGMNSSVLCEFAQLFSWCLVFLFLWNIMAFVLKSGWGKVIGRRIRSIVTQASLHIDQVHLPAQLRSAHTAFIAKP